MRTTPLRVSGKPVLVRRRIRPALFRAGLFDDVNIFEIIFSRIVRQHRRIRIDITDSPVIIGCDLEPVMDAADDDIGGEDIGNRTVLEDNVHQRKIIDIVVVAANMAFVLEAGQTGQSVRAGRDSLRQNRP